MNEKRYPGSLIAIENKVDVNLLPQRSDIVLYNNNAQPVMIVECKSVKVKITQDVFNQIARYNMKLRVPFLVVTNGLQHYCCQMDYDKKSFKFIPEIPFYESINGLQGLIFCRLYSSSQPFFERIQSFLFPIILNPCFVNKRRLTSFVAVILQYS